MVVSFLLLKISLLSYEDFFNYTYNVKCNYVEYIFIEVNKILEDLTDTFKLYDCIKEQMNQLINPLPIVIEVELFTSEIDDFDF